MVVISFGEPVRAATRPGAPRRSGAGAPTGGPWHRWCSGSRSRAGEARAAGAPGRAGGRGRGLDHADANLLTRPTDPSFIHSDPWRALRILGEFVDGFDALARVGPAVSVFGSARLGAGSPYYALALEVGRRLAERGYAVITGGGPGIMEAANRGASEAGGMSVGCTIELPARAGLNEYVEPGDRRSATSSSGRRCS